MKPRQSSGAAEQVIQGGRKRGKGKGKAESVCVAFTKLLDRDRRMYLDRFLPRLGPDPNPTHWQESTLPLICLRRGRQEAYAAVSSRMRQNELQCFISWKTVFLRTWKDLTIVDYVDLVAILVLMLVELVPFLRTRWEHRDEESGSRWWIIVAISDLTHRP